jgi:hypothetical protein
LNLSVLTDFVKNRNYRPVEQNFVDKVLNKMLIDIRPLDGGWAWGVES